MTSAGADGPDTIARSEGPAADAGTSSEAWLIVWLLTIATVVAYSDRLVFNLLIGDIRAALHLADTEFSLLQGTAFGVVFACASPAWAWLSDRTSRRGVLVAGMILWSVATIGCGLASTYGAMFLARALVGLGEAALLPTAIALICERFAPGRRSGALSVLLAGAGVGPGIGVLGGGLLLKLTATAAFGSIPFLRLLPSWRAVLVLAGLPALLLAIILLRMLRRLEAPAVGRGTAGPEVSQASRTTGQAVRVPAMALAWGYLAASFYLIANWAELSWVPALLIRRHGLSAAAAGDVFGLVTIVSGALAPRIATLLSDRLRHRWGLQGRYFAPALGLIFACPACVLLLANVTSVTVLAAFALDTSIFVAAVGFAMALQDILPTRSLAFGSSITYFLSGFVGSGFGPTLVAVATDRLYRNDAAVGQSLVTVTLPAVLIAAAAFLVGARFLRRDSSRPLTLAPVGVGGLHAVS